MKQEKLNQVLQRGHIVKMLDKNISNTMRKNNVRLQNFEKLTEKKFIQYIENVKSSLESPDPFMPLYRFNGGLNA